jgi:hypothetical protein
MRSADATGRATLRDSSVFSKVAIVLWYNSERSSRGAEFWMAVKVRNDLNDSPTSFAELVTLIGDKIESHCDRGR